MGVAELRDLCVGTFPTSLTRPHIMGRLEEVVQALVNVGMSGEVWVDGSFLTRKIDPLDVDILVRISSKLYDSNAAMRAAVDWATDEERLLTHSCDSYPWVEYGIAHPNFAESEKRRAEWTAWYGTSRAGVKKGIAVIRLRVVLP